MGLATIWNRRRRHSWWLLAILLWVSSASAQMQVGDNVNLNLSGNLGYGYSGAFGNVAPTSSSHSIVGSAELRGYYFHPNFVNFQFRPYWDRSQVNIDSQSVTRSTGFGGSVGFFGASHFPGSISFGKDFSSSSEFNVAGVPSIGGDASGQNVGITWSANLPKWPRLTASYLFGSTQSSLFGGEESHSKFRTFVLDSSYEWLGWGLHSSMNRTTSAYTSPAYLTAIPISADGTSITYSAGASRKIPLRGNLGLNWLRSTNSSSYTIDSSNTGTSYSEIVSVSPAQRLTLYETTSYVTNLSQQLSRELFGDSTVFPLRSSFDSHGLFFNMGSSFSLGKGVSLNGYFNHRIQTFGKKTYEDSQYGGSIGFSSRTRIFGLMTLGIGMVDSASQIGNHGWGTNANVSMSRRLKQWDTAADFNYAQNVQTIGSILTTSNYSYGGSVRRRFSPQVSLGGSYRSNRSGIVLHDGDSNESQSISGGVQIGRYNFTGSYSFSNGAAVLNAGGTLTPTSVGGLITDDLLLFDAKAWSATASTVLFRRLIVVGGYSRFHSSVGQGLAFSLNEGDRYNARVEYRLRKFQFMSGYNRTMEDVSTIAGGPRMINSYYLSISRWFNVF